ncbi:MAG: general secretion pathway protein L [Marinobacter sp. T13-3]|nr:MAG: general secretion pathway protein L [Marinobacter sp. T13-3]
MTHRLFIKPRFSVRDSLGMEERRYDWSLRNGDGEVLAEGHQDTDHTISETIVNHQLFRVDAVVFLSGSTVSYFEAELPAKVKPAQAPQMLAYAIEDDLAQPVDMVHVAHGEPEGNRYPIAAIDHWEMSQWVDLFDDWPGVALTAIVPDVTAMPITRDGWTLFVADDHLMARFDKREWIALSRHDLSLFTMMLDGHSEAAPMSAWFASDENARAFEQVQLPEQVRVESRHTLSVSTVNWLADHWMVGDCDPINLCQGAFVRRGAPGKAKAWKPAMVVAAALFAVQVAVNIGSGIAASAEADRLEQAVMTEYRQVFPDDTRTHVGNVKRVLQGQLRVAQGNENNGDFLNLLRVTGQAHASVGDAVQVTSLNYSAQRGGLSVEVSGEDYRALTDLRDGVAGRGVSASIGSVVNEASGTRGRLSVGGES